MFELPALCVTLHGERAWQPINRLGPHFSTPCLLFRRFRLRAQMLHEVLSQRGWRLPPYRFGHIIHGFVGLLKATLRGQ
jgi:hypothetical protein